jgi:Uma2 family endonuclease
MATAPTLPLVSVDEYLNSSYEHDVDFVEGVLVERGMPTIAHSLLQNLLLLYFAQYEKQFRFKALAEARTQVVERARYRVPDVVLCPRPLPHGKFIDVAPLAVMEILSPDDRITDTLSRFRDYEQILGVPGIVLMDPEQYIAYGFKNGSLIETVFQSLEIRGGSERVPFDTAVLFERLRSERDE